MTVLQKAKKKVRAVALRLSQTADVTPECNETTPECQENYLKVKISSTRKNSSRAWPIFINIQAKALGEHVKSVNPLESLSLANQGHRTRNRTSAGDKTEHHQPLQA